VTVFHPLTREQGTSHVVTTYADGGAVRTRSIRVPLRPPLSFASDPFIPLRLSRVDVWFGFNSLACARGLVQRRLGRARTVVLWSVDFVPERFGRGTPLTALYNALDRFCCTHADAPDGALRRRAGRPQPSSRPGCGASARARRPHVCVARTTPTVPEDGFARRRVAFLGQLVPRQGVAALLEALALLHARGEGVVADVIGSGPDEPAARASARALGLDGIVRFRGFVPDHRDIERLLAGASIAVAPYEETDSTFTRRADPGKLKAYLAAGLPIVLTDVPPNARELVREAGAEIVPYDAAAIAGAIADALASPERWRERHEQALRYARKFDWAELLPNALARLGLYER